MTPAVLDDLRGLTFEELRNLHRGGTCPEPENFRGAADGAILHPALSARLRIWRGKFFEFDAGACQGLNRIGIGPLEVRRYRFVARVAPSSFGDRYVMLLDHDNPQNPAWVRCFHDEVVQVAPGLYLASSHIRILGRLRYAAYFALATR